VMTDLDADNPSGEAEDDENSDVDDDGDSQMTNDRRVFAWRVRCCRGGDLAGAVVRRTECDGSCPCPSGQFPRILEYPKREQGDVEKDKLFQALKAAGFTKYWGANTMMHTRKIWSNESCIWLRHCLNGSHSYDSAQPFARDHRTPAH
jgi:hypothetical protein